MAPRIIEVPSQEEEPNNFGDVEEYGDHHWVDQGLANQIAEQGDEENMDWLPEEEELEWAPPAADDEFDALLDNVVQLWPGFDEDDNQIPGLPVIVEPNLVADDDDDEWVPDDNIDYDYDGWDEWEPAGDLENNHNGDDEWVPDDDDNLDDDDDELNLDQDIDDDEWDVDENGFYFLRERERDPDDETMPA